MTEPYARPDDEAGDATIPIVPDTGYAPTEQLPFSEETLVDPTGANPWSASAQVDPFPTGYGATAQVDAPPAPLQSYAQPPRPQGLYAQPQPLPYHQPATTNYAQTNYVQPQVVPQETLTQAGFAEPYGTSGSIGAQNFYQGFPTSGYAQQPPALPAVIHDPVGYDYGYGQPPAASDHPNATTSLVLGILALVLFPLLSPVAWYLAAKGRREMAAFPGRWRPSGSLTAGMVLGIIGTALLGLVGLGVMLMMVALVSFAG
ncbi:MAG: hypothetical protein ACOH1Y_01700 [Propionicimonas sp.]